MPRQFVIAQRAVARTTVGTLIASKTVLVQVHFGTMTIEVIARHAAVLAYFANERAAVALDRIAAPGVQLLLRDSQLGGRLLVLVAELRRAEVGRVLWNDTAHVRPIRRLSNRAKYR